MRSLAAFRKPPTLSVVVYLIDKNSLWGGMNIQKWELRVKKVLSQDLGLLGGPFQGGFGGFSG